MKKLIFITLLIALIFGNVYAQEQDNTSKRIEFLVEQNRQLQNHVFSLESKQIKIKEKALETNVKIEENKKDWLAYLANFWTIIGLLLGTIAVVFSFKEKIKQEVEKKVKAEVAIANNISKSVVERLYTTEKENSLIRESTSVLIVNEEKTRLDDTIKKVFITGTENSKFNSKTSDVKMFSDITDDSLKGINLVVIDNTILSENRKWILSKQNNETKKYELTEHGVALLNLTKKCLSKKIAVVYFSEKEYFPIENAIFNNLENKYLLAYGNAHSKIYPNTMDVLKSQQIYAK